MDIMEVKEHWEEKYPDMVVSLWDTSGEPPYVGMMIKDGRRGELRAETIRDLIQQGEDFIRDC